MRSAPLTMFLPKHTSESSIIVLRKPTHYPSVLFHPRLSANLSGLHDGTGVGISTLVRTMHLSFMRYVDRVRDVKVIQITPLSLYEAEQMLT